jgi:hypothetical protein
MTGQGSRQPHAAGRVREHARGRHALLDFLVNELSSGVDAVERRADQKWKLVGFGWASTKVLAAKSTANFPREVSALGVSGEEVVILLWGKVEIGVELAGLKKQVQGTLVRSVFRGTQDAGVQALPIHNDRLFPFSTVHTGAASDYCPGGQCHRQNQNKLGSARDCSNFSSESSVSFEGAHGVAPRNRFHAVANLQAAV